MKYTLRAAALTMGMLFALPALPDTIVLGINGNASVGAANIDFGQFPQGAPFVPAPGFGTFEVSQVAPLSILASVTHGETGKIQSLDAAHEPVGVTVAPITFMTFDTGGSNLNLDLTQVLPGQFAPGSPFTLTQTDTGVTATFNVLGFVLDTSTNVETPYSGIFSATFSGVTIAELTQTLPVTTPFSATFSLTATPEPASMLLMGIGLLGAGIVARKKIRS